MSPTLTLSLRARRLASRALLATAALVVAALAITFSAAPAWAAMYTGLGPAAEFNLFVLNNNTQSGSDTQGKMAVGNDAILGGFTIASNLGSSGYNLVVGGNFQNSSNTLNGGALVNGNMTWTNPSISGQVSVNGNATFTDGSIGTPVSVVGTYTAPGYFPPVTSTAVTPLPFDFSEVGSYLRDQSAYLASLPANGNTDIMFNQVHLTPQDPLATYVSYNVTGAQMAAAAGAGLFITAAPNATVVINIDGTADSMTNMGIFLTGVDKQRVLYNFHEATSLTLSGIGVLGTILAPWADVNFSGAIDGTLIANNLAGQGESHLYLFQGDIPTVPEPAAGMLALAGLAVLLYRRWR